MSRSASARRDRGSRRRGSHGAYEGSEDPEMIIVNEPGRPVEHDVHIERPPNLSRPPEIHIYQASGVNHRNEYTSSEAGRRPPPPAPPIIVQPSYSTARPDKPSKRSRNRRCRTYETSHPDDNLVEGQDGNHEQMPSIQQTYQDPRRPSRPPRPSQQHPAYVHMEEVNYKPHASHTQEYSQHLGTNSESYSSVELADESPESGDAGGGGCDIQLSAVREAIPDSRTLNSIMVCVYRSSRRRFDSRRIWLVKPESRNEYGQLHHRQLRTDATFFAEVRQVYKYDLRGTFRRFISFKTVSTARILEYGNNRFGLLPTNPKLFSPVFMAAYDSPTTTLLPQAPHAWILWLRKIRLKSVHDDRVDLAIELIEDYDPIRVMGSVGVALTVFLALTITWLCKGGDPGYVCGVMGFVLTVTAAMLGLTGLWDWLDLGHMGGGKDFLVLDQKEFDRVGRDGVDGRGPGNQFFYSGTR